MWSCKSNFLKSNVLIYQNIKLINQIPKKCFVTIEGIRVLIENLLLIEVIKNAHSMGSMISKKYLSKNFGQRHFVLKEFSQLESMKSGRVESEEENEITGELEGWFPDERDLQHLIES